MDEQTQTLVKLLEKQSEQISALERKLKEMEEKPSTLSGGRVSQPATPKPKANAALALVGLIKDSNWRTAQTLREYAGLGSADE